MQKYFLVLIAFFIVLPCYAKKITIVADEWPPFSGEELPNKGLSPHVISAVLTRAGYEVDVRILPWARIIDGAQRGEFDIVGSLFYTKELTEFMQYSQPYYDTEITFLKQKGSTIDYSGLQSLGNYSIAVGAGFLYETEFDKAEYLNKVVTTSTLECIQMLAFNHVDLTLDSIDVIKYTINNNFPKIANMVEYVDTPLTTQSVYMAINKNMPNYQKVLEKFNKTLEDMKQDGSYEKIIAIHSS